MVMHLLLAIAVLGTQPRVQPHTLDALIQDGRTPAVGEGLAVATGCVAPSAARE
jgi:hypothetical protein